MRGRTGPLLVAALGTWLVLAMLWRWPAFSREAFESTNSLVDLSFYAYAGELLRTGATPYVDFWDHKPPLIYLLHAAGLALSGGRVWGVWAVSAASVLAALGLAWATLRRAVGEAGAVLGTTWFAMAGPSSFSARSAGRRRTSSSSPIRGSDARTCSASGWACWRSRGRCSSRT